MSGELPCGGNNVCDGCWAEMGGPYTGCGSNCGGSGCGTGSSAGWGDTGKGAGGSWGGAISVIISGFLFAGTITLKNSGGCWGRGGWKWLLTKPLVFGIVGICGSGGSSGNAGGCGIAGRAGSSGYSGKAGKSGRPGKTGIWGRPIGGCGNPGNVGTTPDEGSKGASGTVGKWVWKKFVPGEPKGLTEVPGTKWGTPAAGGQSTVPVVEVVVCPGTWSTVGVKCGW